MALIRDVSLGGRYARYARELMQHRLFEHGWQLFLAAPLVGLQAGQHHEPGVQAAEGEAGYRLTTAAQLYPRSGEICFILRLILLSSPERGLTAERQVRQAFACTDPDGVSDQPALRERLQQAEELYLGYLYAGLELLHRELIAAGSNCIDNIGEFIARRLPPGADGPRPARSSVAAELGLPLPGSDQE